MLTLLAATWLTWTAENGTLTLTDDPERVPAKHAAQAAEVTPQRLSCYLRYTGPVGPLSRAPEAPCTAAEEAPVLGR